MDRAKDSGHDAAEFDKQDPEEAWRRLVARTLAATVDTEDKEPRQGDAPDNAGDTELDGRMLLLTLSKDISDRINEGDLDGALDIVEREAAGGRLTPEDVLLGRWMVYSDADEPERALEVLIRAERGGRTTLSGETKATLLYRLGRRDELAAWCDAWVDSDGSRVDIYLNRARLMRLDGDTAGALKHANAICLLDDRLLAGRNLAGDVLVDMGHYKEAVERYNESLDIDFRDIYAHVKKAEALVRMGRPDAAALACRRGLDIRPQNKRLKEILAESH